MNNFFEMPTKLSRISIYVDPEIREILDDMANTEQRSLANMISVLIFEALKKRGKLDVRDSGSENHRDQNDNFAVPEGNRAEGHPTNQLRYRIKRVQKHQKDLEGKTGIIVSELAKGEVRLELDNGGEAILPMAYLEVID
ncbi:MAG: hypothetical protein F6K22_07905 [Okeania sp. SIO2F4]|uniref:ribbon-helix-helix domain-containing protein n=1 Tax=Okeania sp. SIO2F4 TaxID=2607790 RepID=UPI00142C8483|nr:hypothetical protein [Okeania sp. SIO2F4]NES02775.1 hypothetical protein [Okeania sp. SIO2F4]